MSALIPEPEPGAAEVRDRLDAAQARLRAETAPREDDPEPAPPDR